MQVLGFRGWRSGLGGASAGAGFRASKGEGRRVGGRVLGGGVHAGVGACGCG